MTDSLLWKHINQKQLAELDACHDPASCKSKLFEILRLMDRESQKTEVVLDFYFYNVAFAREMGFSPEKLSTFFSIMHFVFEYDTNNNTDTLNKSFERFKNLVLMHAVERPPVSVGIFSVKDVDRIIDYVTSSYYRHFRLYKYIFTKRLQMSFQQRQQCLVEEPSSFRPLDEAMTQELSTADKVGQAVENHLDGVGRELQQLQEAREQQLDKLEAMVGSGVGLEGGVSAF